MEKLVINGGVPLNGTLNIGGMKNAALGILFATILVEDTCIIENLPPISDVHTALQILSNMGASVKMLDKTTCEINTENIRPMTAPDELMGSMRASYYVLGASLGRFHTADAACPGGCDFGKRPIEQHIKGFVALGAKVTQTDDRVMADALENGLIGDDIFMDVVSVGATINIMLAATKAVGKTTIDNSAREPHVVDLANFLNACGANILYAGTDKIEINGVEKLHGVRYAIIPDMIEAGTYMVAAAITRGNLRITNVITKHLESITAKLLEMGAIIVEGYDEITVSCDKRLTSANVRTMPYPGFPTDMNPQICVAMCLAEGKSILAENIYNNRFRYVEELKRMGAKIDVQNSVATVTGCQNLIPATVRSVDLRAGAAMVIAALATNGSTTIEEVYHIERGYENLVEKLASVGADITAL